MARTRRSRQAADAPAASVPAQSDAEQQAAPFRSRTRTSRAAPSKRQESVDNASAAGPSRAPASSIRNASVDSVEIGRRALETPSLRRDTTGLDLADDSVFGDLGDSFADVSDVDDRAAAPRSASTTRSWSTFKPRSRASSFVGRNDPPIRPSSRGGAANNSALTTSFSIGAFRRRAREPSILGTTRKGPPSETSARGGGGGGAPSDLESEGEELLPDAESTPLHTGRRRTRASLASSTPVVANTAAAATQRTASANVSAGPATRKRKSEAAAAEERAAKATRTEETDSDSDISDLDSPQMPPSTPIRQRATTPVNLDEINAPPASSDSEDEGGVWPDIHALAKRRRRPSFTTPLRAAAGEDEILSDISSPPSLTHSPNHESRAAPRGRAPLRAPQPKPLTTADLANLLPKRKYKKTRREGANSDEEDDEEEVREEAEEEEEVPATRTRGGRISRPPSRAASASGHAQQQAGAPARRTRSASKHKTYGRRSSDKENNSENEEGEDDSQFQPLADDTFEDTTAAAAAAPDFQSIDELKRATKKFSEVDKWQLEYEELSEGDAPQGAR